MRVRRKRQVGHGGAQCSIVASWIPSSPDECTAMPSWNVSHTAAAFRHARIPAPERRVEQNDVHRPVQHICGELLEIHDDRARREGECAASRARFACLRDRILEFLEIVVVRILPRSPVQSGLPARWSRRRWDRIGIDRRGMPRTARGNTPALSGGNTPPFIGSRTRAPPLTPVMRRPGRSSE